MFFLNVLEKLFLVSRQLYQVLEERISNLYGSSKAARCQKNLYSKLKALLKNIIADVFQLYTSLLSRVLEARIQNLYGSFRYCEGFFKL